jgi:outer membrane protein assembly factor BamB
VKWIFNAAGDVKVDRGTEGCSLDYDNMRVFCGSDLQDAASGQDSLFALDIVTGALLWSTNAGAILNRPMLNLGTNRLYVANKTGSLMAYDPAGSAIGGGQPLWPAALAVAAPGTVIARSPSIESRAGSWQNKILALDSGGTLHAAGDSGSSGFFLWDLAPESGARYRSLPVVLPGNPVSYAFIGRDDGTLQMIELGLIPLARGAIYIQQATTDVYDPSIDLEDGSPVIVVVAGTTVKRLTIPLCLEPPF